MAGLNRRRDIRELEVLTSTQLASDDDHQVANQLRHSEGDAELLLGHLTYGPFPSLSAEGRPPRRTSGYPAISPRGRRLHPLKKQPAAGPGTPAT